MKKVITTDPVLTNVSREHIRHMAQQLLNAVDACPGTVQLGTTTIAKGTRRKTQQSKEALERIIQNKFNKKYIN